MREYIFRGKQKAGDWVGDWIFGDLIYYSDCKHASISPDEEHCWAVDPDSVGQFTEKKDIKKRNIFEGDILLVKSKNPYWSKFNSKHVVMWGNDGWILKDWGTSDPGLYHILMMYNCEIIGNIYDNPELLR